MSIIEDFASINADLSKLEQAKMPTVQPDFSGTDTGDVTDEARKALHAMYGIPMGGGIDDIAVMYVGNVRVDINSNPDAWALLHKAVGYVEEDEAAGC